MDAAIYNRDPTSRGLQGTFASYARWKPDLPAMAFSILLALAILGGGSSRADAASLLYLRPLAVILAGIVLMARLGAIDWQPARQPALLLSLLACTIVVQLVPLPPSLWTRLPGHEPFLGAARIAGMAQPWRPISIAPTLTWNALAALAPLGAALILGAALGERLERIVPLAIIGAAVASTLLSLLQFTAVADGVTYLYPVKSIGIPSGVFANRNHHAVFLAAAMPIVGVWATSPGAMIHSGPARGAIALCLILVFAIAVGVSGSRMGLVLLIPGLVGAMAIGWSVFVRTPASIVRRKRSGIVRAVAPAAVLAVLALVLTLLSGTAAIERLGATTASSGEEQRIVFLPIVLDIARTYLPFGAGFGTFDPAFRMVEPDTALQLTYFNHAHDDLLELVLTGGIPALLVLVIGLTALGRLAWILVGAIGGSHARRTGLGAMAFIVILLAASLTDYPLRTPLLAMTLMLSWMLALRMAGGTAASSLYAMRQVK